jgi:hypothetical protein
MSKQVMDELNRKRGFSQDWFREKFLIKTEKVFNHISQECTIFLHNIKNKRKASFPLQQSWASTSRKLTPASAFRHPEF